MKNNNLHGLRGMSTLGIFLFHSGLLIKGTFLVTLFFMMSGYFLYLNKYLLVETITFKSNFNYVMNKIKKWYPIHLIMFVVNIFIRFDVISKLSLFDNMINGIINWIFTIRCGENIFWFCKKIAIYRIIFICSI